MKTEVRKAISARKSFLVFGSPNITSDEIQEVVEALQSGWIGTGPRVAKFEEDMKNYLGARYAVAVSSCTAALHLSLLVLGVGRGDEVITTPMTFGATANAIVHAGATPVFADIDAETMLIDPRKIEEAITGRTKAIIPVHLAGRPCDMDEITAISKKHGIPVIEDAAHSIEGCYKGRNIGTISGLNCFSFYVTKNITTCEGGMVTTDNPEWEEKLRTLSHHGLDRDAYRRYSDCGYKHYQVVVPGYKYNMTDIQAAIGIHQLSRIESSWQRRNEIWNYYNEALKHLPIGLPAPDEPHVRHARHLYTVMIEEERCSMTRDRVLEALKRENIGAGVHYTALHLHHYYRQTYGYREGDYPAAEWVGDRTISLPLSAKLTDNDVEDVIDALTWILS